MTQFFIYPFRYECDNAIMLKHRLKGQRIKLEGSNYKQKPDHVIINWGNSKCPFSGDRVINQPVNVGFAVNKLIAFDMMRNAGIVTVPITRSEDVAKYWLAQGKRVIGRTLLKSNNGKGIIWYDGNNGGEVKFFSEYVPSEDELRINIYRGKLISIRKKVKKAGYADNEIKSGINGYIFKPLDAAEQEAYNGPAAALGLRVCESLGLDFAGIDVLLVKGDTPRVIEVNTAPELQGAAMDTLANYIKADYENQ